MRERIILAPGINGNELIKSMALHGINTINLRICSAGELARIALMRSGIAVKEEFLSTREECAEVAKAIKDIAYFRKPTYSDIREITGAIRRMRSLVIGNDEVIQIEKNLKKGIFSEKNAALNIAYQNYMKALSDNNQIDSMGLVRMAADECQVIDADFMILKEYPVSPLEKSLLDKISNNSFSEVTIQSLYNISDKQVKLESIKNCYGAPNEVETILNDIYQGKELDKCTVVVADGMTYGQLFFDYALLYDLPISFGCGVPIVNTNPAKLLDLYYRWITAGFFSAGTLAEMLNSVAFNKSKLDKVLPEVDDEFSNKTYDEVLAGIRFTNDVTTNIARLNDFKQALDEETAIVDKDDTKAVKKLNEKKKCIPLLEAMAVELALAPEEFIKKYSYIRKGNSTHSEKLIMGLDMAAVSAIYDELSIIRRAEIDQTTEDLVKNVLGMAICMQNSESGKLHITTIEKSLSSVRENVYIAGLSSAKYPGSPRENYLLLDDDLNQFGSQAEYMTSKGKIKHRQDILMNLAKLSSALDSKLNISYSGLNVSELKRENASSTIFELYKEECGKTISAKDLEDKTIKVEYFEPAISKNREVGKAYVGGSEIKTDSTKTPNEEYAVPWNLEAAYSPSALSTFFGCPRHFMLANSTMLGLKEPDDDNPFETISTSASGTLAHSLMERLANTSMTMEEFLKLSEEYFDRFMKQNPALISDGVESEKSSFLEMMETAYEMDPHREVALAEEDIRATHESGVKIHGYPDRVEKLDDGTYLIVDFKTGRNIGHVKDDIDTCLQIVIYAYLMEQKGYKVSGGEFRYIRLGETISCKYDDEIKSALNEKLTLFKEIMKGGEFPLPGVVSGGDTDPCKYCKCMSICGINTKGGEE